MSDDPVSGGPGPGNAGEAESPADAPRVEADEVAGPASSEIAPAEPAARPASDGVPAPHAATPPPDTRPAPSGAPRGGAENRARPARGPRPVLSEARDPVFRESGGYRLRMDPPDLARLRELSGSKGKTDQELGEEFLEGNAARLTAAVAGDVPVPAELRVVVDPYSRQAFLALENRIRGITSF